ncbi:MAG: 1-(5-phosphoribosyl)-5-[(5-phosphoribosylamino)methylideneamino]imidazole-4-carboxamide isomerase [Oscillospiraceae bacterium]|nr:1-(5-phosphoribosyl)-5-[(5-phosphoribosylamino)methylideneamino]imidazole-4-carboxamide isomerase [Oscillospiraceae bacterium]
MIIYPAIDLFEGKAVRLVGGDYGQMTIYSEDPASVACEFRDAGASAIHIIDLEGARGGKPANFEVIKNIASEAKLEIQVGGGIRTADDIEKYLGMGVKRVILGTAAVSTPGFLKDMIAAYGEAVAVSADMRDGLIAIKGWTELSDIDVFGFCSSLEEYGVQTLICTDISKDGLLGGTNIDLYHTLRENLSVKIVASGGITSLVEIEVLAAFGIDGAILGTALYEGRIHLAEAINTASAALK